VDSASASQEAQDFDQFKGKKGKTKGGKKGSDDSDHLEVSETSLKDAGKHDAPASNGKAEPKALDVDLDFLGLDDAGGNRKSKKKGGKDKDAGKAKEPEPEPEPVAVAPPAGEEEISLEQKVRKERPPPRVRIDSSAQPGYVSLRLENVQVIFKNQEVCKDCSWSVQTGDRVGLVGANGGGKTTQLRVLYGEQEPTAGEVVKSAADLRIAFLRQEFVDELVPSRTLKEELMSVFREEVAVMAELDGMDQVLAACTEDPQRMQEALDRMQALQDKADALMVTQLDSRVEKIMDLMGFQPEEGESLVASFSGGWKMRIGLGKILLTEPNILLLDEPTNHLDLESIEWMEKFLINQRIPMVIVSHDREFLDRVCTKIVDCEGGITTTYDGNYSLFLRRKRERLEAWQAAYDAQQKRIKAERDWINRFKVGAQAPQAASREKKLDKLMASDEYVKKPPTPGKPLRFRFPPAPRMGDAYAVAELVGLGHGYEGGGRGAESRRLFADVSMHVEKGDRMALLGPNGCGKSTLLRLLVGKEAPLEGKVVQGSDKVVTNYYEQNQADVLDLDKTVLETIMAASDASKEYEELRALLGQFLFKGDAVTKKVGMLSGGEKARLALCAMMLRPANFLVLDEPTNHLDIPAKEMLEEALQHYDGTAVIISHDRYFISQVANVIAAIEEKKVVRYNGDYRFYMDQNERLREAVESRYVEGLAGIQSRPEIETAEEKEKRSRNFGGSGVSSGRKDKGVKNAKRLGEM